MIIYFLIFDIYFVKTILRYIFNNNYFLKAFLSNLKLKFFWEIEALSKSLLINMLLNNNYCANTYSNKSILR